MISVDEQKVWCVDVFTMLSSKNGYVIVAMG